MTNNIFLWDEYNHYFVDQHGQYFLEEKPVFSFDYETITYHKDTRSGHFPNKEAFILTVEDCEEIENFIKQKRAEIGVLKHCVDKDGEYLGFVSVSSDNVFTTVDSTPPNADPYVYNFETKTWMLKHFYNSKGDPVPRDAPDVAGFTTTAPPETVAKIYFDNTTQQWIIDDSDITWRQIAINKIIIDIIGASVIHTASLLKDSDKTYIFLLSVLSDIKQKISQNYTDQVFNELVELIDSLLMAVQENNLSDMQVKYAQIKNKIFQDITLTTKFVSAENKYPDSNIEEYLN